MKKYIDIEKIIKEQRRFRGYLDDDILMRLEIAIRRLPVDIQITKCEECIYSKPWYGNKRLCYFWNEEEGNSVFNDGFCSYGKKDVKYFV